MARRKLTLDERRELARATGRRIYQMPMTRRGVEGALVREENNVSYHRVTDAAVERAMIRAKAYADCLRNVFGATEEEIDEVLERVGY